MLYPDVRRFLSMIFSDRNSSAKLVFCVVFTALVVSCSSPPPEASENEEAAPQPACETNSDCEPAFFCETETATCLSSVLERCEYRPLTDGFVIEEEWSWSGDADVLPEHDQIMMAPAVANLTDDNGDGSIDENDVPDIVFQTFAGGLYVTDGVLRAVSGDGGTRLWPTSDPGYRAKPGFHIAIGDLVNDSPGPEIVTCEVWTDSNDEPQETMMVVRANGTVLSRFREGENRIPCVGFPAIGDMNGDGVPEFATGPYIAHADGTLLQFFEGGDRNSILVDIDDDDDLELVLDIGAYNYDGTPVWERASIGEGPELVRDFAVADLDGAGDSDPEIIVIDSTHFLWALESRTGEVRWGPVDINVPEHVPDSVVNHMDPMRREQLLAGGGPPAIANYDDDPQLEISIAGGYSFNVYDHDGTLQWAQPTRDRSSRATGSSMFDFEGDGVSELLYNDERTFHVYRGTDGEKLYTQCNTSGTLLEFPVVADVDNDGRAEIVLIENNYSVRCLDDTMSSTGFHVYGHPSGEWVGSRPIFNQHSYHVTNINDDGTVPEREPKHWETPVLNAFRQNLAIFDVPDLIVEDMEVTQEFCPEKLKVQVRVINRGASVAPPGIPVSFFSVRDQERTFVGRGVTSKRLNPGDDQIVALDPAFEITQTGGQPFQFMASINHPDHEPRAEFRECHTDNNDSDVAEGSCENPASM